MPWTPDQFRSRHAHNLSPAQSAHAAQIANAILRRSPGSEGMAIATGIARAKGHARGGSTHDTEFRLADQYGRDNLYTDAPQMVRGTPTQVQEQYRDFTQGPGWGNAPSSTKERSYPRDYDYEQFLKENPSASDIYVSTRAFGGATSLPRLGVGLPRVGPPPLPRLGNTAHRASLSTPHLPHFQTGGDVSGSDVSSATTGMYTPGVTAASSSTASPIYQSLVQRFQGMSPEQLQEFVARAGNTSSGQVARRLLTQKRMMSGSQPASSAQANTQQQQQQQQSSTSQQQTDPYSQVSLDQTPSIYAGYQPIRETMSRGGGLAGGGSPMGLSASEADPWWTRQEARTDTGSGGGGFLHSAVFGRTDHITSSPAADSYVIPADVVSGLGEGNSLAGAKTIATAMGTAPWGQRLPPERRGSGPPRAITPRVAQDQSRGGRAHALTIDQQGRVVSGGLRPGSHDRVPAMLAGGEYVLTPEQVAVIGRGDVRRGHRVLDHFVKQQRAKTVKEMKKLPGPVKA